jgi:hypothetical protein
VRAVAFAAAGAGAVGLGLGLLAGPADALDTTPGWLAPAPIDFGRVAPSSTRTATVDFDVPTAGSLTLTSPDPRVFTVTSVSTYRWVWQVVDTGGDLPPGHRPPPLREHVLVADQTVSGPGPVAVTRGERVEITVAMTAPSSTPVTGLTENLVADDGGTPLSLPVSVTVVDIRAAFVNGTTVVLGRGQAVAVPVAIHSLSGPATVVAVDVSAADGTSSLTTGVQPIGLMTWVVPGDMVGYVWLTARADAVVGAHPFHGSLIVYGIGTTPIGDLTVVVS